MANGMPPSDDDVVLDPLVNPDTAPISVPDSNDSSEGGKLKMILQLVKRSLGVKDIAAMRISLPASLLEPLPNLEYWQYLDRPDLFAAINDSTDPFERMLAVLRFTFSKDLKFIHGKIVKPYNSVLGEHFRAHWTIKPVTYPSDPTSPPVLHSDTIPPAPSVVPSEATSTRSSIKSTSIKGPRLSSLIGGSSSTGSKGTGDVKEALSVDPSSTSLGAASVSSAGSEAVRVVFLTEQVSHHPPISSFFCAVPEKGIEATGVDQISAKVSATSLRVSPGTANQGIFISLISGPGAGEKYQITHPVAIVAGILRGNPYATISESAIITCTRPDAKQHLRAIIDYKEESWIGRAQFLIQGVIHEFDPEDPEHLKWNRVRHVPPEHVVATFDGCWQSRIYWKRAGESTKHTLLDLSAITVVPKTIRPVTEQEPSESQRLWQKVTENLLGKNFSEATRHKQAIEQEQRDLAAERKKSGKEFVPVYFEPDISSGEPKLTAAGRKAVEEEAKMNP